MCSCFAACPFSESFSDESFSASPSLQAPNARKPMGHPVLPGAAPKPKQNAKHKTKAEGSEEGEPHLQGKDSFKCGSGTLAEAILCEDLFLQNMLLSDAKSVAALLHAEAAALAAKATKELHQALSGKALAPPPLRLSVHRHTLDLQSGAHHFVKLSHAAYHKLVTLHRKHSAAEASAELGADGEDSSAEVRAALLEARGGVEGDDDEAEEEEEDDDDEGEEERKPKQGGAVVADGGSRGPLHQRLFALLLRYKSLRGHGFQAAIGPDVWQVLRDKLQVAFECFASPLNW